MALFKRRGFQFDETMTGTYAPVGAPHNERPIEISLRAQTNSAAHALKTGKTYVRGSFRAQGLADHAETAGTLELQAGARRLRYDLEFRANDGEDHRFRGEKRFELPNLLRSLTVLRGDIENARGGVVATAELRFDVRGDLLPFLASWRPA